MKSFFGLTHSTQSRVAATLAGIVLVAYSEVRVCMAAPDAQANGAQVRDPSTPDLPPAKAAPKLQELFPGVYADVLSQIVELDATISPMLVPDAKAPRFYLEVLACSPSTREHETFFVVKAKPSHIHAALLAAGFHAGTPGNIQQRPGNALRSDPTGDRLQLRVVYADLKPQGNEIIADPLDWLINAESVPAPTDDSAKPDGKTGTPTPAKPETPKRLSFLGSERGAAKKSPNAAGTEPGWVFAGSRMVPRPSAQTAPKQPSPHTPPTAPPAIAEPASMYQADGAGVIIGLTTFGSEVIAWSRAISPDASIETPEWVADFSLTPPAGTKVRLRITPESQTPANPTDR